MNTEIDAYTRGMIAAFRMARKSAGAAAEAYDRQRIHDAARAANRLALSFDAMASGLVDSLPIVQREALRSDEDVTQQQRENTGVPT